MNRRGHMSTRIPNVKLRPVPNAAGKGKGKKEGSPLNALDEEMMRKVWADAEDEDVSTAALNNTARPWEGIVLTFTGVDNKPHLTKLANQLGASVESALTVNVTHVIASGFGSPKYQYAVEHRLPVLQPSWIEESHARWIGGEEIHVQVDISAHKLSPFLGARIAISGIEPLDRRKQLLQHINSNGGTYSKDLDRKCTHLVSAKPTGEPKPSEKVQWALKELSERDAKRRAGKRVDGDDIRIVYEEWIWDCIAFEGRWKEDLYDARKPRRGARVEAEDVINGTYQHEEQAAKTEPADVPENNEPAVLRKRKRENIDSLVGDIISTTNIKAEPDPVPSDEALPDPQSNGPLEPDQRVPLERQPGPRRLHGEQERKPSVLHSSRTNSFTAGPSTTTTNLVSATSAPTTSNVASSLPPTASNHNRVLVAKTEIELVPRPLPPLFVDLKFSHDIEEQADSLEKAVVAHGGEMVSESERLAGVHVDYIVVRLASNRRPELPENSQAKLVTECWVEACCFEQKLLPPESHLVFQPLPAPMPIPGADALQVHLSGLSSEETAFMRRLTRAIGANISVKLNRQTTHLVCAKPEGQKYVKALEWGVSAVKDSWLLAMGRSGRIEPSNDHQHALSPTTNGGLPSDSLLKVESHPSAAAGPSSHPSISPSRMLKLTPTHIDDKGNSSIAGSSTSISHPLSPPKSETERLLNRATPKKSPAKKLNGSPLRNSTASPSGGDGKPVTAERKRSSEMTEALRQLAQKDETVAASRSKIIRRSRPSSRLKTTTTFSPHPTDSHASRHTSPSPDLDRDRVPAEVEESVRINYVDPLAEREKHKLLAAMRKSALIEGNGTGMGTGTQKAGGGGGSGKGGRER